MPNLHKIPDPVVKFFNEYAEKTGKQNPMKTSCKDCRYYGGTAIGSSHHISCDFFTDEEKLRVIYEHPTINTQWGPLAFVGGDPWGIQKGWFLWPINYDEAWKLWCLLFEEKEPKNE